MKKGMTTKVISAVFLVIALLCVAIGVTTTGTGVLDLSNIVKYFAYGIAAVCAIISVLIWKMSQTKDKSKK